MDHRLSRRHFLQKTGGMVLGAVAFALIEGNQGITKADELVADIFAASPQSLLNSDIEKWLLSTGQEELEPSIYTLLTKGEAASRPRVFLPNIQR